MEINIAILCVAEGLSLSKKNCFYLPQWNAFKNMKNAFYFILKALFIFKIFKLLSSLFGHKTKTAWLKI